MPLNQQLSTTTGNSFGDGTAVMVGAGQVTYTWTLTGTPSAGAVIGPGTSGSMTSIPTLGYNQCTIQIQQFGTNVTALNLLASNQAAAGFNYQGSVQVANTISYVSGNAGLSSTTLMYTVACVSAYIELTTVGNQTGSSTIVTVTLKNGPMQQLSTISATLGASSAAIGSIIGQRPFEAYVTITRPSNTTAYSAGQVLSTATSALSAFPTFALGIGNSQRYIVTNISLFSSYGAAGTKGQFSVELFNAPSPSGGGFNDAAAFAVTAAAQASSGNAIFGTLGATATSGLGTAAYGYALQGLNVQGATSSSGNTYLAITVLNTYTPASGETITVKVAGLY